MVDSYGQTKAGFSLSGQLSRKEFGLTWDAVTEAGNIVVSDEVRISAEVQVIKKDIIL
ncbi:YceI family protein [Sphingobacterium sp. IITKGP-BTPF85]|uniref:YceI family protein n=1 Tax=Sphingobacterium sp. IITKGP-BTPF85 TaxID=1338009 RepID=UPI000422AD3C